MNKKSKLEKNQDPADYFLGEEARKPSKSPEESVAHRAKIMKQLQEELDNPKPKMSKEQAERYAADTLRRLKDE